MYRWLAQSPAVAGYRRAGFGFQKVACAMQGTRGKLGPLGRGRRLTRSSSAQSCAASHAATPGLPPHSSPELVNHSSLAHAAVSTVRYLRTPQSAATLLPCCPAALSPRPGLAHGTCTPRWASSSSLGRSRTHARRCHWASGGRPRVCSCIVDRCSTPSPRHAPSQIPRRPIAQSRAPSSVSLCRSISASLLFRDHVYSTLQTPSRAPSSQRPPLIPSLTRPQAPSLSRRSQLPNCSPNRPIPQHPRPGATHASRFLRRSDTFEIVDCSALQSIPPDREGSPIPVLPRRGHAALNMRKRETRPYVSQHNER